jgi:hypothetical protein
VLRLSSPPPRAAATNARTLPRSFTPGALSTPLATSTHHGSTRRTASATLSGVSPPASTSFRALASDRTRPHSNACPVPPSAPRTFASTSTYSPGIAAAITTSSSPPMRTALYACGRSASTTAGGSSPDSCRHRTPVRSTTARASSTSRSATTATTSVFPPTAAAIAFTVASSTRRTDDGTRFTPSASTPSAAHASACATVVTPQTFTHATRRA